MAEGVVQSNAASLVEDVLQQHGKRLCDLDLASRKAHEASLRRYDAAEWLRKMVGVVAGKDLPAEPSEEDFRLGLRSGIILCNVLNKVQPGSVPKVVAPSDSVIIPDGAALSAFQYFENIRNFLDAIEEMGIPTFEASDLEQGGKSSRIVNCILALKSYHEWKQCGGRGLWKYSGNTKPSCAGKPNIVRKNSDLFMNFISRNSEKSLDSLSSEENSCGDQDNNEVGTSSSLQVIIRDLISDKNREDIPLIVENMLSKVMEEFEQRSASQNERVIATSQVEQITASQQEQITSQDNGVPISHETVETETPTVTKDESCSEKDLHGGSTEDHSTKYQELVEYPQRVVQELKEMIQSAKYDMQMLRTKHQEEFVSLSKHMNSLAHAASGYRKVLEENRKLYNQVQDLKGSIRVYCRVRPFLPGQLSSSNAIEDLSERTITIPTTAKSGKAKKSFTFNKVFGPSASQEEVFADTQPLIRSVLDGYNVCLFAYGQTGSGKTYTMTGPKELTKESLGVNYRALGDLFEISEQRKNTISYDISVQMMEIYNEQVRDLLITDGLNKKLEIRNNTSNGINVPNANLVPVSSTADVINLMNLGHKNRAVGSTAMNDRSSRSHSCLTVHVQGRDLTSGAILRGCMHLVDLAGSERVEKTEATGDRLKEAQHINKSLSALGDVISSLAQKNAHVPYRNSKLTQLLQDSLGGQAKTLMFVHISPEADALGETLSTLKFAERVSTVVLGAAKANKESVDVKELKEQIATLKAALARKDRSEQHSRSSTPDRQRVRSRGSSPSHSSWNSSGDACKPEGSSSRRHSLDLQEFLMSSSSWPSTSPMSTEEENGVSGDHLSSIQSPEIVYQKHNTSKVHPEQTLTKNPASRRHSLDNGFARKTQYETVTNDDDIEIGSQISDTSEPDNLSHLQKNLHKSKSMSNVVATKVRKPSPKPRKIPQETSTRSLIPQPSKKASSNGKQLVSGVTKRKPTAGK